LLKRSVDEEGVNQPMMHSNTQAGKPWTPLRKGLVSMLLALHLFAVFAAPCASPPPASFSWNWLAGRVGRDDGLFTPYLKATFLNHGYRFFAPNPGPSHLVRFEIDLQDGAQIGGKFPDPNDSWPRLLYHRMFMISETLFNLDDPIREPPPPEAVTPQELADFQSQRATADALIQAIARRLLDKHQGERVRLFLQTHNIPFPGEVSAGRPLDDPQLYVERPLGEFSEQDL
jgi:hypothetical protein